MGFRALGRWQSILFQMFVWAVCFLWCDICLAATPIAESDSSTKQLSGQSGRELLGRTLQQIVQQAELRNFDRVETLARKGLDQFPDEPSLLFSFAYALEGQAKYQDALEAYQYHLARITRTNTYFFVANKCLRCRLLKGDSPTEVMQKWKESFARAPIDQRFSWWTDSAKTLLEPPEPVADSALVVVNELLRAGGLFTSNTNEHIVALRGRQLKYLRALDREPEALFFARQYQADDPLNIVYNFQISDICRSKVDYLSELDRRVQQCETNYAAWAELLLASCATNTIEAMPLSRFERFLTICRLHSGYSAVDYVQFYVAALESQKASASTIEQVYRVALKSYPTSACLLNSLAYSYALRKVNLDEAMQLAKSALVQEPYNPAILDTKGWLHYLKEEYRDAAHYLLLALERLPDEEEIVTHLVETFVALKLYPSNHLMWEQLYSLNPRNKAFSAHHKGAQKVRNE